MNLDQCKELILKTIVKEPDFREWQFSLLSKKAWKQNKSECIEKIWWIHWLSEFVFDIKDADLIWLEVNQEQMHGSADELDNQNNDTNDNIYYEKIDDSNQNQYYEKINDWTQTQYDDVNNWETELISEVWTWNETILQSIKNEVWTFGNWVKYVWIWIVSLIILVFVWQLIKYLFAFVYDVLNSKRLVYLKVILPRLDTKADREREKELAKDMKEKIGRMSQVYRNFHKLWELSAFDVVMRFIFTKPKISLILHYENWLLNFIFWTYPEYANIIEWAITAQYSDASIETVERPNFYKNKHTDLIPLIPVKSQIYPIRIFKQLEDDPLNNIMDSIWKIPTEDTFSVFLTMKPEWEKFNRRAQKMADWLFKKDEAVLKKRAWWKILFTPRTWIWFLVNWPSEWLVSKFQAPWAKQWDPFIRMVKAEEEALNTMWEEAWKQAFHAWILLLTTSSTKKRCSENLQNVISAYTIYKDEYNNELDQPEWSADLFGWILKPCWRFAIDFMLPNFSFKKNIFTISELASLFHLPDWMFNRSPAIKWMDYKALACPDNVPQLKDHNGRFITWIIAEDYKWWNISSIFKWLTNPNIGFKTEEKEELIPISKLTKWELAWKKIITENWKKFIKRIKKIKKTWIKLYRDWILLWLNVYRNRFTPIYMKRNDRTRHHYVIWKSGWGKSVYIASLARQDIWSWDGCCVIDPHGDLVEDILKYVPKERAKDIIYFDAWNEDRPMWLNLYEINNIDQADRVVNDATEIFLKMFGSEIFWPRIQEYFKYWSLTLLEDLEDWATLLDVTRLFTDDAFREYKTSKVTNPVVKNFWEKTYNSMGDREKQEIIPYFTSKFVSFNTNRLIRNIIWQTKSAFNFRDVMDSGKILLINLSKWKIWELNAQLLWMIVVSQIYIAAMSRADIDEKDRKDFYLYVDEFQNFVSWTFADILSEARKYRLWLIMAHQYIAQLDGDKKEWWKSSVKDAVFGNVWTIQSFKVGAPDAEALEKEYAPVLSAQDIVWISNYKTYTRLNINNSTSRVFSMNTIWTQDYENKKIAPILKEYSSKKYWRKREFVDAEITARMWMMEDDPDETQNTEDK